MVSYVILKFSRLFKISCQYYILYNNCKDSSLHILCLLYAKCVLDTILIRQTPKRHDGVFFFHKKNSFLLKCNESIKYSFVVGCKMTLDSLYIVLPST